MCMWYSFRLLVGFGKLAMGVISLSFFTCVSALLRRSHIETERRLIAGNLELDADGMTACVNGQEIKFPLLQYRY